MRTLSQWLDAYGESHQNAWNRAIHHVCVPCIMWSLLGLLWLIPLPFENLVPKYIGNIASILVVFSCLYYFWLSWRIAIGALIMSGLMLVSIFVMDSAGWPLMEIAITVFILAWTGQFIGHGIEGKRPSFAQDMRFLLIGPLWVITHIYEAMGVSTDVRTAQGD